MEKQEVVRDKACAGGISSRSVGVLRRLEALDGLLERSAQIRHARVIAPDGAVNTVTGDQLALVMRRSAFDTHMLEQAHSSGAELTTGASVDRLLRDGDTVVGAAYGDTELEADLVVLANGAHNKLGWDSTPKARLDGVVQRYEGSRAPLDQVQLAFHREVLPHYAWVFPEPEGTVNVGLCREHKPGQRGVGPQLEQVIEDAFPDLEGAKPIGKLRGHPIVFTSRSRQVTTDGAVAIGEAARLTDGFTGEGIWHALVSGEAAASAIADGDTGKYARRAKVVLDPMLGTAVAFKSFARTRWFEKLIGWSAARPFNLFLLKTLSGLN